MYTGFMAEPVMGSVRIKVVATLGKFSSSIPFPKDHRLRTTKDCAQNATRPVELGNPPPIGQHSYPHPESRWWTCAAWTEHRHLVQMSQPEMLGSTYG